MFNADNPDRNLNIYWCLWLLTILVAVSIIVVNLVLRDPMPPIIFFPCMVAVLVMGLASTWAITSEQASGPETVALSEDEHDAFLINLYREFSEQWWAAGWYLHHPGTQAEFAKWLEMRMDPECDRMAYEEEGLPVLRAAWVQSQAIARHRNREGEQR